MHSSERNLVHALALFRGVKDVHFDQLIGGAFLQRFPQHVVLINEGQQPDFLHIIIDGMVELFATVANRETTIEILRPVTTFILAAVIRDEVYLKSARTLTPAQILMIPAITVREVFAKDAAFARAVVDELALRYRGLVRTVKELKLHSGTERLANWILDMDRQQGETGSVELPYGKRTLASFLGMSPENLSRNLTALTDYSVTCHGRQIVIADREKLRLLAKRNDLVMAEDAGQ
jgi:CRP/FNR family transcriptional activator FtrB